MAEAPHQGSARTVCWRRVDAPGLELLLWRLEPDGIRVESSVICGWCGGYRLDHLWELTPDWRVRSLRIERLDATGRRSLALDRDGDAWRVGGVIRADLDGADAPDISVTPFCNSLIMRRVPAASGATLTVDTAYVNGDDLTVVRSRQRYERKGPRLLRYVDLGAAAGFEADLHVDDDVLVVDYEHLFARVDLSS